MESYEFNNLAIREVEIKEEVDRKIVDWKQIPKGYGHWTSQLFNNFPSHLILDDSGESPYVRRLGRLSDRKSGDPEYSELRRNQTSREWDATIRQVIEQMGSLERLVELRKSYVEVDEVNEEEKMTARERFYEALIPLYIRLRALGYNHADIWK